MHLTTLTAPESTPASFSDDLLAAIDPSSFVLGLADPLDRPSVAARVEIAEFLRLVNGPAAERGRGAGFDAEGLPRGGEPDPDAIDRAWHTGLVLGQNGLGWAQPPADYAADEAEAFLEGVDEGLADFYAEPPSWAEYDAWQDSVRPAWGGSID